MTSGTPTPASRCSTAKASATIGKLLGHEDPATTMKYVHLADATAREAVRKVGAVLAGAA